MKIALVTTLLVIVTVTALALGVVMTRDSGVASETEMDQDFYMGESSVTVDSSTENNNDPAIDIEETSSTTEAPTTITPTAQTPSSRVSQVIHLLVEAGVSAIADMETAGSPQQQAVLWVADLDEAPVALVEQNALIERYALTVLYYSTEGPKWPHQLSFLTANPTCNWYINGFASDQITARKYGVSCSKDGTITNIHFPSAFLVGDLPSELAFLRDLERFEVFNNPKITGGFPAFLKAMPNLNYLGLHYCGLTGTLPNWLGSMTTLTSLVLSNNNFSGELPMSTADLINLENLYLDDCNLEGEIEVLRKLTNLKNIVLEDNAFVGELDDAMVGSWERLETFDASHNRLKGTVPKFFFQLPTLRVLDLHGNTFSGPLPKPTIDANTAALEILTLNENDLSGEVPAELGQFVNLKQLDFTGNKFTSTIPAGLGNLKQLEYLYAAQNPFKASGIPTFLTSLTSLKELSLKNTQLVDTIPDFFGSMSTLTLLDLDHNRLTGTVPASLSNATSLEAILLNRNQLEGTIPAAFASLDKLSYFMVEKNKITGSASPVCGNVSQVHVFAADCKGDAAAVDCACCTVCCAEGEDDCNDKVWLGDSNPIWELDYQRAGPIEFDASASRTYKITFGGEIP